MIGDKIPKLCVHGKILLIQKRDCFLSGCAQLFQGFIYHLHLRFRLGIGRVHHMNDIVRVFRLLKSALESLHKMMGQFPDKSYRICEKKLLPVLKFQKSRGGIQRGKKFVLRLHSRPGKNIQKSGFTRVGISHDSRSLHPSSGAASPDQFPVFLHLTEFFFQGRYPCTDQSSVCLQFLFAGPSGADPASQPGQ